MVPGVIIRTASIAERHPAAPADIPRPIMEITATQSVRGASILTLSIAEAKPAPAAVRQPMTMLTTAILMVHGSERMIRSISAQKLARFVRLPVMNTPIMWMPTAMANVTTAAQRSA